MGMGLGPRQEELVSTWEHGGYDQAMGVLHTMTDKFCCLGVACDLYNPHRWTPAYAHIAPPIFKGGELSEEPDAYAYCDDDETISGEVAGMPQDVQDYYGFRTGLGGPSDPLHRSLSHLNDNGTSFKELAAIVRYDPHVYFSQTK